jgi:hypothetical protein
MKDILTPSEIRFLASQGLDPDDVMDVRSMPQWLWFKRIEEKGKNHRARKPLSSGGASPAFSPRALPFSVIPANWASRLIMVQISMFISPDRRRLR